MSIKKSFAAALIAAGFICQATADNVVYLTGSTACRSTVYTVLNTPGYVFDTGSTITRATRKYSGTSINGATYMLFHGPIGGTMTYVDCVWSGSEAGIASAANQPSLDNGGTPLAGVPAQWLLADGSVTGDSTSSPLSTELEQSPLYPHGADLAMADTSQAVSWTPTSVANLKDYASTNDMAIICFTWVKNTNSSPNTAWNNLANINTAQMQALFSAGRQHASFLTGNAADTNYVYLVGRNKGSGTRANVLADSAYGIQQTVNQFSIGGALASGTPSGLTLLSVGNDGYESGGNVRGALLIDGSCGQTDPYSGMTGWMAVGYLGCSDAAAISTSLWLTENGVAESDGAVIEGSYTYWGNEHILGKQGISGYQDSVGQLIHNGMKSYLNGTAPTLSAHDAAIGTIWMHATKSSDTAYPSHN